MTLTKAQIVERIQSENSFSRKRSIQVVETLLDIMKTSLESGDDVLISGFGKFCVKAKTERRGRNPATGEAMMLEPRKVVTFKCSGKLKEMINWKRILKQDRFAMIEKIISGGQTGTDQAALDAAIKLGIPHGGWIPKGRLTENGPLPDKYHLQEMPSGSYEKRTLQNVLDSDGTVIISHGNLTGGSEFTMELAKKHKRPYLHVDLNKLPAFLASSHISTWVKLNKIKILNVAGPRASKDPLIYRETFYIIENVILLDSIDAHGSLIHYQPVDECLEELSVAPKTVDEAVNRLISEISPKDRVSIVNKNIDELLDVHNKLCIYLKSAFRLDDRNDKLLESCRAISNHPINNTDDVATVIIGMLYKKLIETHKMRLV